jgi:uncharacterized membrane protein YfcA
LDLADLAWSLPIAVLIGALVGLVGIGGVLLAPWLVHGVGLGARDAMAIALCAFIATGIASLRVRPSGPAPQARAYLPLLVATVPGALAGALLLPWLPARLLLIGLASVVLWSGLRLLVPRHGKGPRSAASTPADDDGATARAAGWKTGAVSGLASAVTGTGGPVLLVPWLLWRDTTPRDAIRISQFVQLPIALTATIGNLLAGGVDLRAGAVLGLAMLPSTFVALRVAPRMPLLALQRLLGGLLVLAGGSMLWRTF